MRCFSRSRFLGRIFTFQAILLSALSAAGSLALGQSALTPAWKFEAPRSDPKELWRFHSLVMSPDERVLAASVYRMTPGRDGQPFPTGKLILWDARSRTKQREFTNNLPLDLQYQADGSGLFGYPHLQIGSRKAEVTGIYLWQPGQLEIHGLRLALDKSGFLGMRFLADNGTVLTAGAYGVATWQFNPKALEPSKALSGGRLLLTAKELAGSVPQRPLAIAADGRRAFWASSTNELEIWDLVTKKRAHSFAASPIASWPILALSISNRGERVALSVGDPDSQSGKGELLILDGATGKVEQRLTQHERAVTALALSGDGRWLIAALDDRTLGMWDAPAGKLVARLSGLEQSPTAVIVSPQLGWIYAGTKENAAYAWDVKALTGAAEPTPANRPEVAKTDPALFRGSRPVWIELNGKPEIRDLLTLTSDKLVVRRQDDRRVEVFPAAAGRVTRIRTADKVHLWTWTRETGFTGPQLEPDASPEIRLATDVKLDRSDLTRYCYFAWRRLQRQGFDATLQDSTAATLSELSDVARRRADWIRVQKLSPQLAEAYAGLPAFWETMRKEAEKQRRALDDYNRETKRLAQERKAAEGRAQVNRMIGIGSLLLGSMPTENVVYETSDTIYVERGVVSQELAEYGLATLLSGVTQELQSKQVLGVAAQVADKKTRDALETSAKAQAEASSQLEELYRKIGATDVKAVADSEIPASEWLRPRRKASDYRELLDKLEARRVSERDSSGRDTPFSVAEIAHLRSLIPAEDGKGPAHPLAECAQNIVAAADLIPSDAQFDPDRATLLTQAAELLFRSAAKEVGGASWNGMYHPAAARAVVLLRKALASSPADKSGRARELLAWSSCLAGEMEAGLATAQAILDVRGSTPRFRYNLARAKCAAGKINEGMEDLHVAILELGFDDLLEARRCQDFPRNDPRFKKLTEIEILISQTGGFGPAGVQVTNRSAFPLRAAQIQVAYKGADARNKADSATVTASFPEIEPGEAVTIALDPKVRLIRRTIRTKKGLETEVDCRVTLRTARQGAATEQLK